MRRETPCTFHRLLRLRIAHRCGAAWLWALFGLPLCKHAEGSKRIHYVCIASARCDPSYFRSQVRHRVSSKFPTLFSPVHPVRIACTLACRESFRESYSARASRRANERRSSGSSTRPYCQAVTRGRCTVRVPRQHRPPFALHRPAKCTLKSESTRIPGVCRLPLGDALVSTLLH